MDNNTLSATNPVAQVNREFAETKAKENAALWGFSYVDLREFPLNPDLATFIPEAKAKETGIIVFQKKGKHLRIAVDKPADDGAKNIAKKLEKQGYSLEFYVCSPESLQKALKLYQSSLVDKKSVSISVSIDEDTVSLEENITKFSELEKSIRETAIPEILNQIYLLSVSSRASDIHFQPSDDGVSIRIRVDGVLWEVLSIPLDRALKMIPQIKYDGGLKSNITESPQDGHIEFIVNDRAIELRVSTLPMEPCESIVMRILDSRRGIKSFAELGFDTHLEEKVLQAIQQKNGIILVTGPTGSGKTTTLYSMLKELNTPDRKLVTLEDPIEYRLPGVSQSQVDDGHKYNFETGFRSLLRHDPDVILVGEIRTIPTAKLAFEAALTGHTVLSSLHTNSAIGAVSRLRNMGMENYNIAPTINAVFAQRLVRTLGPTTPVEEKPLAELVKKNSRIATAMNRIQSLFPHLTIPKSIITDTKQKNAFFKGQIAICEAFLIDEEIREMILIDKSEASIRDYLLENTNFLSMFEVGLMKVLERKTTLVELVRVVGV